MKSAFWQNGSSCMIVTTELLETVMALLNHCSRFYSHADRNMTENLIVRLEVAVDSVHHLDDSLDSGAQAENSAS